MKIVSPKCFLIGETRLVQENFQAFLEEIGVPEWTTDAESDTEVIVESSGKLCYMSFDTSLNMNLTRTGTRNNMDYIQKGLIGTKHGSVIEHPVVNFVFTDVSRILTHELVRHRAGAAYSQTSGRYVRTNELSFWVPSCIARNPELNDLFIAAIEQQEHALARMVEVSGINQMAAPSDFHLKKQLTSAFRRIVGNGVANNIAASYNHRALRHIIAARTNRGAEEEIRLLFNMVADQVQERYPAVYADMSRVMVDDHFEVTFENEKV